MADNDENFDDLYSWSCANRAVFFEQVWQQASLIHEGSYTTVVDESKTISQLPRWFEGVRLNFAENLLWSRGPEDEPGAHTTRFKEDGKVAIVEVREGNSEVKHITWAQLRRETARLAGALHARGVRQGDRVVIVGSHSVQTFIVFLATTWLGAIFSSSSTDMGVGGLLQRTVQINPKVQPFCFFPLDTGMADQLTDCLLR